MTVDPGEETALAEEYWPGFMLGPLVMSRAGVRVVSAEFVKEVAERSTLYWALTRRTRPASDLSHGWGGNSQWRTEHRRDYLIDGTCYYNVDIRDEPSQNDGLDPSERMELVRHRCFVRSPKPHEDLWPYDIHHAEGMRS